MKDHLSDKRQKIVVTGVNLESGGTLSVFNDLLAELAEYYSHEYDILVFHSPKNTKKYSGLTYYAFPLAKKSYLLRLFHEKVIFFLISQKIEIFLWLSMHDITPVVTAERIVTYAHNPSPFYNFEIKNIWYAPTFAFFNLFYQYVYLWNISRNSYLVVQQFWLLKEFQFLAPNVPKIVARPDVPKLLQHQGAPVEQKRKFPKNFSYSLRFRVPSKKLRIF